MQYVHMHMRNRLTVMLCHLCDAVSWHNVKQILEALLKYGIFTKTRSLKDFSNAVVTYMYTVRMPFPFDAVCALVM